MSLLPLFIIFTLIWNIHQSLSFGNERSQNQNNEEKVSSTLTFKTQFNNQTTIQLKLTSRSTTNSQNTPFTTSFKTRFYNSPENHQCRVNREADKELPAAASSTERAAERVEKKCSRWVSVGLWFFSLFAFFQVCGVALCRFCRRVGELDSHSTVPLSRSELQLEESSRCVSLSPSLRLSLLVPSL